MAERSFNPFRRKPARPAHRFSAQQIATPAVAASVKQMSLRVEGWQLKVLKYADIVPEVLTGYAFVHNTMDQVTFEIQRFDRPTNAWVSDDTPPMQGIERRINNTFKAGRAAAIMHLIEEVYVLVSRGDDGLLRFETLAPTEIKELSGVSQRRVLKDGVKLEWEPICEDVTIIRIYTPSPANRHEAGGPHKALLGLLENMAVELLRDQADAISVLAGNGILTMPTEILPDEGDTLDASDTPGTRAAFEHQLEDAMLATITDRSRGEAVVPILVYGPAEFLKEIRHILPKRAETSKETSDRMEAYVRRYARDIDLPSQIILGMGDANHWADWKVDENTWAYHLEPRAQRIADALYRGLVRGIICNLGLDPDGYRLVPNATKAIAKQDMSRTAIDAYKLGAITPEAFVEAVGFDASDMRPDAEEAMLATLCGSCAAPGSDDPTTAVRNSPDRTAAARPSTILKNASKLANRQQDILEQLYRGILAGIAKDAARDGAAAAKKRAKADKTAAAKDVKFEGYDASVYFDKYRDVLTNGTTADLFTYLRRIATLIGADYLSLRNVWATEFPHRAEAVTREAESIAGQISRASYGSGKPARVPNNAVRTLTSTANGGANASNGAAGNTQRPTDAGDDPAMRASLTEAVGSYATRYTWTVGEPHKPFHPHQELEGRSWFSWQEFDALDVDAADAWLPGSVYFPGDHDGCQCGYTVEFVAVPATGEAE